MGEKEVDGRAQDGATASWSSVSRSIQSCRANREISHGKTLGFQQASKYPGIFWPACCINA